MTYQGYALIIRAWGATSGELLIKADRSTFLTLKLSRENVTSFPDVHPKKQDLQERFQVKIPGQKQQSSPVIVPPAAGKDSVIYSIGDTQVVHAITTLCLAHLV